LPLTLSSIAMFEPIRGGTRGGQAEFKWTDVSADKDRENYLGHSINAPTGRWQKNKDIHWYNRETDEGDAERQEEIRRIKEAEAEAMSIALGFGPSKKDASESSGAATGANAIPGPMTKTEPDSNSDTLAAQKEERRRRKEERKREKQERREQRRADKAARREHSHSDDRLHNHDRQRSHDPERSYRDCSRSRSPRRRAGYHDEGAEHRSLIYKRPYSRSRSPVPRQTGPGRRERDNFRDHYR